MSTQDKGGPAFPCEQHETQDGTWNQTFEPGMTLRDYFAAKALPACIAESCEEMNRSGYLENWQMGVAMDAYRMADAMIEARKQ